MANLTALLAQARFLYNAPYTDAQATALMNDALVELSEFFPVIKHSGFLTVADVDEYELPTGCDDISEIVTLGISRTDTPTDRYDFTRYEKITRDDYPKTGKGYYQVTNENGYKLIVLYPIPTIDDLIVSIQFRSMLTPLATGTDVPEINPRYHKLLVYYALHWICARSETPDTMQADFFAQKWEDGVNELKRAKLRRSATHPRRARDNGHWHPRKRYAAASVDNDLGGEPV